MPVSGKRIGMIPKQMAYVFGREYFYELSLSALHHLTKEEWQLRIEGQLCSSGTPLRVTSYEELRSFIAQQLKDTELWEEKQHES